MPRFTRVFLVAAALSFVAMACWSFATPLVAAPDEPSHVIRAAALVRGELFGNLDPNPDVNNTALGLVALPKYYGLLRRIPICYHRSPTTPASCAPSPAVLAAAPAVPPGMQCGVDTALRPAPAGTCISYDYAARYPPLYYALVGLPSLLANANWAIYAMRLLGALWSACLLGLAFAAAICWSRSRLILTGLLVGTTPLVCYLGGVVNPSGLEVAAATCVWICGAILALERAEDPPPGLVPLLAVSACLFAAMRSISPFWLALAGLLLGALAGRRSLAALARRRDVRISLVALGVVVGLALAWTANEHAFNLFVSTSGQATVRPGTPTITILENSFAHNAFYVPTMVGVFGSFDTFSPSLTYLAWYGLIGLVLGAACLVARRREIAILVCFLIAILVLPVLISSSQAARYGYTWNGRDTLPFALGLPILAAVLWGRGARTRAARAVAVVAIAAAVAQFAAFYEALRRYAVGTSGPAFGFIWHPSWRPPGGIVLWLVLEAALLAGVAILLTRLAGGSDPQPAPEVGLTGVTGAPR